MNKELPIYKLDISEEDGALVTAIALVENPAIEVDFLAFSKQQTFQFSDDKMIMRGPFMIPNHKMYRNIKGEEFYAIFERPAIEKISQQYLQKGFNSSFNIEHNSAIDAGCYLIESFIIDREVGINPPKGFESLPDGSWFGSVKCTDPAVWADIKAGKRKGFSVEGVFTISPITEPQPSIDDLAEAYIAAYKALKG